MIYTFGDSVLDSTKYSGPRTAPVIVSQTLGEGLLHYAQDGARCDDLDDQWRKMTKTDAPSRAMISIGGNDFLWNTGLNTEGRYLLATRLNRLLLNLKGAGVQCFVANIYDPTFDDDTKDFLGIPRNQRRYIRAQYEMLNDEIAGSAKQYGVLVDLHDHFLRGDPSWFWLQIEPSAKGAEEIAKAFLAKML